MNNVIISGDGCKTNELQLIASTTINLQSVIIQGLYASRSKFMVLLNSNYTIMDNITFKNNYCFWTDMLVINS